MNLEERTNQLFLELVNNPQINSSVLCKKFELTRGQLNYALKKINDSLQEQQLASIKRTKTGHFIVSGEILSTFKGVDREPSKSTYAFSSKERIDLIQLRILSKEDYLSLNHFIDELKVSRNTILRDLKEAAQGLKKYDVALKYTRKNGYFIEGDEWNKRKLLADLLTNLAELYHGNELILKFGNIDCEMVATVKKRVALVEEDLNVQFTDERVKILPLLIILIIRRAQKGKHISYRFQINDLELADTKEYQAADRVIWDSEGLPENERIYLTMLLLTTNLSRADMLSANEIDHMRTVLEAVIENFEKIAGIKLEKKEKLLDRLLVHMRPAYYRIKFHLNLQTKFYQENKNENLFSLFYLVKEASGPLENYFGQAIPEPELFFISLFIGSHIVENSDIVPHESRKKAIIVCPNGVSMAILLENTLKNLLPEVDFVATMSVREFYQTSHKVDFVFSAVPLKTKMKVFVVNNYLSDEEKKNLRGRFLQSASLLQTRSVTPESILSITKKYADIKDEDGLYKELFSLFTPKETKILEKKRPHLIDLLDESMIHLFEGEEDWPCLLAQLAKPLKQNNIITDNYLVELKKEMPRLPDYIILRNKIALPHTTPEAGALSVGISLGIVKKGIISEAGKKIHTVILLGSNDKEEHIDLIFELMSLAGSTTIVAIEQAQSVTEIRHLLKKFSEAYWRQ